MAENIEIKANLLLGASQPKPIPLDLTLAVREVQVIQGTECPSGFQISFAADRYPDGKSQSKEYPLLTTGLLNPFNRAQITVSLNGVETVLMDGFITRQEINGSTAEGYVITVTGEDVSIKMDLFEVSAEFENLKDSAIAAQVLGTYSSLAKPKVSAPSGETAPQNFVPQQNSTDRYFLKMLAARNAFDFYIQPGPSRGSNTSYWGPRITSGTSQKALTANMGETWNNLGRIHMSYDALAATVTYGSALDFSQQPAKLIPIAISGPSKTAGLAQSPALPSSASGLAANPTSFSQQLSTLATRGSLLWHPGLSSDSSQNVGQAKTDRSLHRVVTVRGDMDAAVYGGVLVSPGLVDLRGVGTSFDGTYYVQQVTHQLVHNDGDWTYTQAFVLTREGVGATIQKVKTV